MENARRIAFALTLALATVPAGASMLYKSIGPNGVVQFSDLPPGDNSVVLERRDINSINSGKPVASTPAMNVSLLDADDAIARASAQVDLAEHALALARRSMWSELEGLKLTTLRASASDRERVEFYKRGVRDARQNLMEMLRARSSPTVLASR